MIEFKVKTSDLKTAVNISILGVEDKPEAITGLTVFKVTQDNCILFSTNNDKKALASIAISDVTITNPGLDFATNPKKILSFINTTDQDFLSLKYDEGLKTLIVSDSEKSFISLECIGTETFLSFEEDFSNSDKITTINSDVFINGIKFVLGYTSADEKSKYSCVFIKKGIIYGANGSTHIGAFVNEDMGQIENLVIRHNMITPMSSFISYITKTNSDITIKISDKSIFFCSTDDLLCFGYKKSTLEAPNLPTPTEMPNCGGYRLDKKQILKKLTRLSLSSKKDEIGIKMILNGLVISMETLEDRKSIDELITEKTYGKPDIELVIECNRMKKLLNLFDDSKIDFFSKDKFFVLYSEADFIINENTKKRFKQIGTVYKAKIV